MTAKWMSNCSLRCKNVAVFLVKLFFVKFFNPWTHFMFLSNAFPSCKYVTTFFLTLNVFLAYVCHAFSQNSSGRVLATVTRQGGSFLFQAAEKCNSFISHWRQFTEQGWGGGGALALTSPARFRRSVSCGCVSCFPLNLHKTGMKLLIHFIWG